MNETDVIGLSEGVNCVNCQPKQRQPLIVSSAPSSRQVICQGAGEGGDGGIGEVEKGVFPFFLRKGGKGWKEVEVGGIPGVRLTPSTLRHRSNRWKVLKDHCIPPHHPSQLCFTLEILKIEMDKSAEWDEYGAS